MLFQTRDALVLEQELCLNRNWQRKQSFHFRLRSLCFLLLNSYGWFLNFEVGCRLESEKKAGDPCESPTVSVIYVTLLLAGTFAGCLCLLHPFRHLRFHCVKVETRAFLHRWVIEEGLEFLTHHLLDENKAPELELEPIEVLLPAFFRPVVWPPLALKRIETQIDQEGNVHLGLGTKPAIGLVDETILVVVNAHRAYGAFAEVEDLVARGLVSLACNQI